MTTISAKLITDSILPVFDDSEYLDEETRLTTLQLRYPRAIHAEFMTHRLFSRNASSSRAIPVKRLIEDVINDPFIPLHWGKNQRGMQADGEHDAKLTFTDIGTNEQWQMDRQEAWLNHMNDAVRVAEAFDAAGYHKQIVNRLLEPFAHINVIVTSSQWSNFLALRDHPDAEPHIQLLAQAVRDALDESEPVVRRAHDWHLPYVSSEDAIAVSNEFPRYNDEQLNHTLVMLSVARCARVSYLTHDGRKPDIKEDLILGQRLLGSVPLHASPAEHQATMETPELKRELNMRGIIDLNGNFAPGWVQFRKTLSSECQ